MSKKDNNLEINCMIVFIELKNTRGYPLTGVVDSINGNFVNVNAFGLYGPGTETLIKQIPIDKLKFLG